MIEYDFLRHQHAKFRVNHGGTITTRPDHGTRATKRDNIETPASHRWVGVPKSKLHGVIEEGIAEYFSGQSPKLS